MIVLNFRINMLDLCSREIILPPYQPTGRLAKHDDFVRQFILDIQRDIYLNMNYAN